jgi:hypothetical protein
MSPLEKRARLWAASGAAPSHAHSWLRRVDSVGLFRCASCAGSAVCPGCLNSLDVALLVQRLQAQGISAVQLYWCTRHRDRCEVP